MKPIILSLTWLALVTPALALTPADLDARLGKLTVKFELLQQKPDRRIPAEVLSGARGLVLLDRTKAGFGFAYQAGGGVLLVKNDRGQWSPPMFLKANEASLGFQVGGEQNFLVFVLRNTNLINEFTVPTAELGGAARGTAGNDSGGVGTQARAPITSDTLVYTDRTGLYGGAFLKNDVVVPDNTANLVYYGQPQTAQSILFEGKVQATPAAMTLAKTISQYSK